MVALEARMLLRLSPLSRRWTSSPDQHFLLGGELLGEQLLDAIHAVSPLTTANASDDAMKAPYIFRGLFL